LREDDARTHSERVGMAVFPGKTFIDTCRCLMESYDKCRSGRERVLVFDMAWTSGVGRACHLRKCSLLRTDSASLTFIRQRIADFQWLRADRASLTAELGRLCPQEP
jgi:hypothetical protein